MEESDLLTTVALVFLSVFAVIGLAAVVVLVIVAVRFRHALPGAISVLAAVLYGASPLDLIPEGLVGPIGLIDDVGILGAAVAFLVYQLRRRRGGDGVTVKQLPDDD